MRAYPQVVIAALVWSFSQLMPGQSVSQGGLPKTATGPSGGEAARVPSGTILVKGAWSSTSDSATPVPEGGSVVAHVFRDRYFGITYPLPPAWTEKYRGPPPSDSGLYVLAQLSSPSGVSGPASGGILIGAQDLFFTSAPARNAVEFIDYMKDHLSSDYKVETAPEQIAIAGRDFIFFAYRSPAAELHWYVLATQIRCHVVQFVLTSRDTKLLESLMVGMNRMKLSVQAGPRTASGGGVPVCIKDYARDGNITARVDPVLAEHKFDPVPVRIIIGQNGKVRHIHFLSAFPDQSKAITEALSQWKFKPYAMHGQPMEVETGVLFGRHAP